MHINSGYESKITSKIKNKRYLLQFLPKCINHLSETKHINYYDKKLKSDYIIDIISNLLLKYYFKKENKFQLNAEVLKLKYGYKYKSYIDYLLDNNIIYKLSDYKKGYKSRTYSLDKKVFKSDIKRYRNFDRVLLKKYKKRLIETIDNGKLNKIKDIVKSKLINDLFSVDIDLERAIFFLNAIDKKDIDLYNRNIYSAESINNKHIFYHFDNYGRFHTNFTILKGFIRKNCLLINGEETYELDIQNSQPLFLAKLINESESKWVKQDELNFFKKLTNSGKFYDYLSASLKLKSRKKAKELTYKVLFGRNYYNSKHDIMFQRLFPTIYNFIKLYKKEHGDYKKLAWDLQGAESDLIFNKIIFRIMDEHPEIKIITIHDSIIIPEKYKQKAEKIFYEELKKEIKIEETLIK